jgi:hypothetical protein
LDGGFSTGTSDNKSADNLISNSPAAFWLTAMISIAL